MSASRPRIPRAIWALGFVSLLMDVSSELIHSLLPVFMFTALGISAFTIGLIEGAAEATALIVKVFSGALAGLLWDSRAALVPVNRPSGLEFRPARPSPSRNHALHHRPPAAH